MLQDITVDPRCYHAPSSRMFHVHTSSPVCSCTGQQLICLAKRHFDLPLSLSLSVNPPSLSSIILFKRVVLQRSENACLSFNDHAFPSRPLFSTSHCLSATLSLLRACPNAPSCDSQKLPVPPLLLPSLCRQSRSCQCRLLREEEATRAQTTQPSAGKMRRTRLRAARGRVLCARLRISLLLNNATRARHGDQPPTQLLHPVFPQQQLYLPLTPLPPLTPTPSLSSPSTCGSTITMTACA
jgi:hypothetical protein